MSALVLSSSSVPSLSVSSANRNFSPSLSVELLVPVWPQLGWRRKDAGSDVSWLNGGLAASGSSRADRVGRSGMRFLAWAASSYSSLCWSLFTNLVSFIVSISHGWSELQLEMWRWTRAEFGAGPARSCLAARCSSMCPCRYQECLGSDHPSASRTYIPCVRGLSVGGEIHSPAASTPAWNHPHLPVAETQQNAKLLSVLSKLS